jgi:hypothetical protein
MKRQIRQKEAEFMKETAVLVQEVDLLKMQLVEGAEREKSLKKMNESVMNAFQRSRDSPEKERLIIDIDQDHPFVIDSVNKVKTDCALQIEKEKERHR